MQACNTAQIAAVLCILFFINHFFCLRYVHTHAYIVLIVFVCTRLGLFGCVCVSVCWCNVVMCLCPSCVLFPTHVVAVREAVVKSTSTSTLLLQFCLVLPFIFLLEIDSRQQRRRRTLKRSKCCEKISNGDAVYKLYYEVIMVSYFLPHMWLWKCTKLIRCLFTRCSCVCV